MWPNKKQSRGDTSGTDPDFPFLLRAVRERMLFCAILINLTQLRTTNEQKEIERERTREGGRERE